MGSLFSDLGGLASSLYQATNQPGTPSASQMLWKALVAEAGGLGMQKQQQLNQLLAIPTDQLTPAQAKKLAQLQSQMAARPSFLQHFLDVEQKYQPQFDKTMMDRLQTLAPELNTLQGQLYQQQQNLQTANYQQNAPLLMQAASQAERAASPDYYALQGAVTQQAQSNLGQGLNPQQLQFFRNQEMAAQASRGLQDSPLGSAQEAMYLTQLNMAQQQQNYQNALAAQQAYRQPLTPSYPSLAMPMTSLNELQANVPQQQIFQTPSFNAIAGLTQQQQQQQLASSLYNNQLVGQAIQYGTQTAGDIATMAAGGMGGGMGMAGGMGASGAMSGNLAGGIGAGMLSQMGPNPYGLGSGTQAFGSSTNQFIY